MGPAGLCPPGPSPRGCCCNAVSQTLRSAAATALSESQCVAAKHTDCKLTGLSVLVSCCTAPLSWLASTELAATAHFSQARLLRSLGLLLGCCCSDARQSSKHKQYKQYYCVRCSVCLSLDFWCTLAGHDRMGTTVWLGLVLWGIMGVGEAGLMQQSSLAIALWCCLFGLPCLYLQCRHILDALVEESLHLVALSLRTGEQLLRLP